MHVFGPLKTGMVVLEQNLASLVRQTAVNAARVCRHQMSGYKNPYMTRRKALEELEEKYKSSNGDTAVDSCRSANDDLHQFFSLEPQVVFEPRNGKQEKQRHRSSQRAKSTGNTNSRSNPIKNVPEKLLNEAMHFVNETAKIKINPGKNFGKYGGARD